MKLTVTTTRDADEDIQQAVLYIAEDSPGAALLFEEEVFQCLELLADNPGLGRVVRRKTLRRARVSERFRSWLVFYRCVGDTTLEVVHVLHGSRDIGRLLQNLK
jgi:toxin ParE1/3/4